MEVLDACVGLKEVLNEVDSEVASRRRLGLDPAYSTASTWPWPSGTGANSSRLTRRSSTP